MIRMRTKITILRTTRDRHSRDLRGQRISRERRMCTVSREHRVHTVSRTWQRIAE